MNSFKNFLEFPILKIGGYQITVSSLVLFALIILVTQVVLFLIKKALLKRQEIRHIEPGHTYAIFQIIKYVIWVVSIALLLETIGINVTVLIAGSAALLVGVGLGLQQTFNDIISGIILLSERSIKINDVLEIDNDIVKIQEIGLRTSKGLNRDDISIIIPNSLITTSKVINWSHQTRNTRFSVYVGVAYGSDVDLVVQVLEESAREQNAVSKKDPITVQFLNFGSSSLDFRVLFFSDKVFRIEQVKSEIRKTINRKFREHKIQIPFPQMDVHMIPKP
jgi:small-conductance mechanosensitive channel